MSTEGISGIGVKAGTLRTLQFLLASLKLVDPCPKNKPQGFVCHMLIQNLSSSVKTSWLL